MSNALSTSNLSASDLLAAMIAAQIGVCLDDEEDGPVITRFARTTLPTALVAEEQTAPAPPPIMTKAPSGKAVLRGGFPQKPKLTPKKARELIKRTQRGTLQGQAHWILQTVRQDPRYSFEEQRAICWAVQEELEEQLVFRSSMLTQGAAKVAKEIAESVFPELFRGPITGVVSEPPPSRPCIPPPSSRTAEVEAMRASEAPNPVPAEELQRLIGKSTKKKQRRQTLVTPNATAERQEPLPLTKLAELVTCDQERAERAAAALQRDAEAKARHDMTFVADLKAGAMKVIAKAPSKQEEKKANKKKRNS